MLDQPMDPRNGFCDTFICYRGKMGSNWGQDIYEWMAADPDNHYGWVYYSEYVPNANFLNDIAPMIATAKNIVVVVTEDFTRNFPQTKEAFATEEIVTAQEIHAIMARMRQDRGSKRMPKLILLYTGEFSKTDRRNFTLLATDYGQRDEPEMTDWLVKQFITAGQHKIIDRGVSKKHIWNQFPEYLKNLAIVRDLTRHHAATKVPIEALPFKLMPQTIRLQGESISIDELAHRLIHEKHSKTGSSRLAVISGDGGMGKTTQLQNLCYHAQQKALEKYNQSDTIHFFLPAHRLNNFATRSPTPLYSALANAMGFHSEDYWDEHGFHVKDYTDPEAFIKGRVFANPCKSKYAPCLLCIDAVDEIEDSSSQNDGNFLLNHLISELPEILSLGVAVILTCRSSTLLSGGMFTECIHGTMNPLENMMDQLPPQFRPAPKTPLAQLLKTPFYFTMYCNTVTEDSRSAQNLEDLYNRDMARYYHHKEPTAPGELIWNYVMRHIARRAGQNLISEPNDCRRIFFLMIVLPRLAAEYLSMIARPHPAKDGMGKGHLSEETLSVIYDKAYDHFEAEGWCPFWELDTIPTYTHEQIGPRPQLRDFISFSTVEFPVLRKDEQADYVSYRFSHALMLEFFAACDIINTIAAISRHGEGKSAGILREKKMPAALLKLVGEICGERRGTPYFGKTKNEEKDVWLSPYDKTNNLVRRSLNSLRNTEEDTAILVNNLVSILKYARTKEDHLPDLSGIDFSGLDMTKCSLNQILFSHHGPDSSLCARFTGTKFDPVASFSEGHRAISYQLAISAMIEWLPHRLLSVDETGCCVLWDENLGLVLDVKHLKNDGRKHCISNMTTDNDGCVWVACDDELFRLRISQKRNEVFLDKADRIPTKAVKHLGWQQNLGLYYHSVASPLTRRLKDGRQAPGKWDSRWYPDAVVNSRGDTAFCLKGSLENHRIQSVGDIICKLWNADLGIWEEIIFFSERKLQDLTGYPFFSYGHLFLSPDEKTLLLALSCNGPRNAMQSAVLEFDLEKFYQEHTAGQLKRYYHPVSGEGAGIHSACFGLQQGSNRVYFSSYLSIYSINSRQETRRFHAGEGRLRFVQFLPGTFRFFTLTDNPVRIHVFACPTIGQYRCVSQIELTDIRVVNGVVQVFQFKPEMEFQHHDSQGYAEHPQQLRLLLQYDRDKLFEVDLSTGLTRECLSEGTVLIKEPLFSYHKDSREAFSIDKDKQAIMVRFRDQSRTPYSITLHPGWLFAGCTFDGAKFGETDAPDQFSHYIQVPASTEEVPEMIQTFDDEAFDYLVDDYFDEEDNFA